jgi:hypothetical protein
MASFYRPAVRRLVVRVDPLRGPAGPGLAGLAFRGPDGAAVCGRAAPGPDGAHRPADGARAAATRAPTERTLPTHRPTPRGEGGGLPAPPAA